MLPVGSLFTIQFPWWDSKRKWNNKLYSWSSKQKLQFHRESSYVN